MCASVEWNEKVRVGIGIWQGAKFTKGRSISLTPLFFFLKRGRTNFLKLRSFTVVHIYIYIYIFKFCLFLFNFLEAT